MPFFEESVGASAILLCAVERHVGVPEEHVRVDAVSGRDRYAYAGSAHYLVPPEVVGTGDRLDDALRKRRRPERLVPVGE